MSTTRHNEHETHVVRPAEWTTFGDVQAYHLSGGNCVVKRFGDGELLLPVADSPWRVRATPDYLSGRKLISAQGIRNLIVGTVLAADSDDGSAVLAWHVVTTDKWSVTGFVELFSSIDLLALSPRWRVIATLPVE